MKLDVFKKLAKSIAFRALTICSIVVFENLVALQPGDPRSHLDINGNVNDEGFRWRNNFDFTINGQNINHWYFKVAGNWSKNHAGANGIHQYLSVRANHARGVSEGLLAGQGNQQHIALATVTVVINNNGQFEAYSIPVDDDFLRNGMLMRAEAVAIPAADITGTRTTNLTQQGISMFYGIGKIPGNAQGQMTARQTAIAIGAHVLNTVNALLDTNIPAVITQNGMNLGYGCCEGQIISRLFDTQPPILNGNNLDPLFPRLVNDAVAGANNVGIHPNHIGITGRNIVLVVLHIHTRKDPCGKCSRMLTGLSRQMNINANNRSPNMQLLFNTNVFTQGPIAQLTYNLGAGNARFLIELSSDTAYDVGGTCSHAEMAGHDANTNIIAQNSIEDGISAPINIVIPNNAPPNAIVAQHAIAVPGRVPWNLEATFPPYVVYGRIGITRKVKKDGQPNHVVQNPPLLPIIQ